MANFSPFACQGNGTMNIFTSITWCFLWWNYFCSFWGLYRVSQAVREKKNISLQYTIKWLVLTKVNYSNNHEFTTKSLNISMENTCQKSISFHNHKIPCNVHVLYLLLNIHNIYTWMHYLQSSLFTCSFYPCCVNWRAF